MTMKVCMQKKLLAVVEYFGFHEQLPAFFSRMKWCLEPRAPPGDDRHFFEREQLGRNGRAGRALFVRVVSGI